MAVSGLCAKLSQANRLLAVALRSKDKSETASICSSHFLQGELISKKQLILLQFKGPVWQTLGDLVESSWRGLQTTTS